MPLGLDAQAEAARIGVRVSSTQVRASGAQLDAAAPQLADATIRMVIDTTLPLPEAARAQDLAGQGHIHGKIVLTVA